jgi:thiol-disulfide isomerase/thioredoxin
MSQTLNLGPLAIPAALVLASLALVLAGVAGRAVARRLGRDAEPPLLSIVLAGLLAARLGFIARFHDTYLAAPLSVFDIRDGGFAPWIGLGAGLLVALAIGARRAAWRQPLAAAIATAAVVWGAGWFTLHALDESVARLPELTLSGLDGQPVALTAFHGRPTVVNLWATWCPPCRREMPVLQQAQASRPDVNFVFLNQGEAAAKVQGFLAGQHLPLRNVLLDTHGQAASQFGARGLPTTLFFDADGRLTDTRIGELSPATLEARLGPSP